MYQTLSAEGESPGHEFAETLQIVFVGLRGVYFVSPGEVKDRGDVTRFGREGAFEYLVIRRLAEPPGSRVASMRLIRRFWRGSQRVSEEMILRNPLSQALLC